MNKVYIYILIFISLPFSSFAKVNSENIKKAIVTIESRVPISAYSNDGNWTGTGFIVDKQKGLIVTNRHVTGSATVGSYIVTFENGQQTEAKSIFYDSFADVAIMKVNPNEVPEIAEKIEITNKKPKTGDEVFIIGNAEGQGFSLHEGHVADLHAIDGDMPASSYVINTNSTGGSSGSPILDSSGKAIGILYGGGKTFIVAAKSSYIINLLDAASKDVLPKRRHIGILTQLVSLDKATKHQNFPQEVMNAYIKSHPDARNRVVSVRSTLASSPAENILLPGDIIWKANNVQVGADLSVLDEEMNKSDDYILLSFYRNGKLIEEKIKTYDLNQTKVKRMIDFAGAIIFEVDEILSAKSGLPIGCVAIANVRTGSSFGSIPENFMYQGRNVYRIKVNKLADVPIKTLDDVKKSIHQFIDKKYIQLDYTNYQPYYPRFGDVFNSAHENLRYDIMFDTIDTKPRFLYFDTENHEWKADVISK